MRPQTSRQLLALSLALALAAGLRAGRADAAPAGTAQDTAASNAPTPVPPSAPATAPAKAGALPGPTAVPSQPQSQAQPQPQAQALSPSAAPTAVSGASAAAAAGAANASSAAASAGAAKAALGPQPTSTPEPGIVLPQAPGQPQGQFLVLTRGAQAPQPSLRLRWAPSEPGDFIVEGYRVFRSTLAGAWERRGLSAVRDTPIFGTQLEDPVQVGAVYDYVVEAVDNHGHAGPRSPAGRFDLRNLDAALVQPPAPTGLTATSRRDDVLLRWDLGLPWVTPVSAYQVWRAESPEGLGSGTPVTLTDTAYTDRPPQQRKLYWYAIASLDQDGRRSSLGLSASAQASGVLPPGAPRNLTTRARTEKVSLSWDKPEEGTAALSGYLLRRREEGSDDWRQLALLGLDKRDYTDKAPGDRGYLYSLAAFDAEGNTGAPAFVGASPSAKALNKTLVVLMPTAYANNRDGDRGLNENVIFDFYVGSLFESYTNPTTGQSKNGQFQPLQIATVTTDTKLALLDDSGLVPGIAAGLYISALINFGQPTGAQTVGISSSGGGIATLGNAYAVMSKRFWPGEPMASIHGGIFVGGLADSAASAVGPDWELTTRHLLPGGDVPTLLTRFVDPKLGARVGQSKHLAFGGLQLPFTLPLGFTRWRTGLRVEYITPLATAAEYAPSSSPAPTDDPATQLPWLLNVHIDNLPLFGFEFGYLQYPGGFQLIAFYHIPDLTWSW